MIYTDFESILVLEVNGRQNSDESYTNRHQKHVACSFDYQLVCIDDKFSKPFKSCLGKVTIYKLKRYDDCLIMEELGKFSP